MRVWWSNCLFYALNKWWHNGGYLIVRRSRVDKGGMHWRAWWPHFLWTRDLKVFHQFKPVGDLYHVWFPPPVFRGYEHISEDDND